MDFSLLQSHSVTLNIMVHISFRVIFTCWLLTNTVLIAKYVWRMEGAGEKVILSYFKALSQS
jgi:hypothetical protein